MHFVSLISVRERDEPQLVNSVRYRRICLNPVLHVLFSYGMVLCVQYGDNHVVVLFLSALSVIGQVVVC